jgi:hypothetical protein
LLRELDVRKERCQVWDHMTFKTSHGLRAAVRKLVTPLCLPSFLSLSLSLFFFWRKAKAHPWSREETNEDIIRVHTRKGFLLLEATIRVRSDTAFYLSWNVTTLGRFSILVLHAWFDLISNQHINCSLAITSVINHRN